MTRDKIEKFFGPEWVDLMSPFVQGEQMEIILKELARLKKEGTKLVPEQANMFRCFKETPLSQVRVIILGKDPYSVEGYGNGLAFAHKKDKKLAPSLEKIIDAVEKDCYNGLNFSKAGFDTELTQWAAQGVLLMNTAFTVPEGSAKEMAGKHADLWRPFTNFVVKAINDVTRHRIWLAWGRDAQEFLQPVDVFSQFPFMAEHPSAAAREKRDWNCKHFSITNAVITANKLGEPIKW